MKIALLTEIINSKSGSRAPCEIAKALSILGHDITVFAYNKNIEPETKKNLESLGIKINLTDTNKFTAPFKIYKDLVTGSFDIVSFHGTMPFFIGAKFSKVPIVRTYYGTQLDAFSDRSFPNNPNWIQKIMNNFSNLLIKELEKFMLNNSRYVISISKYCQKELLRFYGVSSKVIYLGAPETSTFRKKKNESIKLLSVSRLVPYKGFHLLIFVFNRLRMVYPKLKLTIIGSSPNPKYLNYLKNISKKKVEILVNADKEMLAASYRSSDIYVSFDRFMFFGMPPLEAASYEIPSVLLDSAASGEVVKDGITGYLAKDDKEFEKHLKTLIDSPSLRLKMGHASGEFAKNFSWARLAKEYEKIFLRFGNK